MLRLCGFCVIIVQLYLAVGMFNGWNDQKTQCDTSLQDRTYFQMRPPRFDPLHSDSGCTGNWPTAPFRHKFIQMRATNKSVQMSPKDHLISFMLKTQCQQIINSWNTVFHTMAFIIARSSDLIHEAFQNYFSNSDSSGVRNNNTSHSEKMMSVQVAFQRTDTDSSHQAIIIMEEDPAVVKSATCLFERHPTLTTLLSYQKGALRILRGSYRSSTTDVQLVGHGSHSANGTAQLAGYGPEELAQVVLKSKGLFGHVGAISLISCNFGEELQFMSQLLQVLRSVKMETKLHLHRSLLSVHSDGKIMSRNVGVWRSHDSSSRVTAELDHTGKLLTRAELGCVGPVFPAYEGNVLYRQTLDWPNHPQMFVPMELRKKYPSIDCLEGLTWSLFFEENERRRAPDYVPEHDQRHLKAIWIKEKEPDEDKIIFKHITNIQDLLIEIRYNAREVVVSDLYYILNDCIYKVHNQNLSVTLVGKFMSNDSQAEIELFRQTFSEEQGEFSLQELRQGLKASKFNDFCRQTFQFKQCSYNCERWGRYFMAAVFSASVRNFRVFSLFLMSVIGCEVGRHKGSDSPLCSAFVGDEHPMVSEPPGPEHLKRGFYGCTVDSYDLAPQNKQIWLDQTLAKENALYIKSRQMMNAVDHDEQTELDIFGRVKVMNKYVFSSYLEFFRGTPEGKKLKRGCAPSFHDNRNS